MLLLQHFTKSCSKCKEIKLISLFSKKKSGLQTIDCNCKDCRNGYAKSYRAINKEKIADSMRKYNDKNRKVLSEKNKLYRLENADKLKKARVLYYSNNAEKLRNKQKRYRIKNKEYYTQYNKRYYKNNSSHLKSMSNKYYILNKDDIRIKSREYAIKNKQRIAIVNKIYRSANFKQLHDKKVAYLNTPMGKVIRKNIDHKRRSLKKQGDVTNKQLLELEQSATNCYWCHVSLKNVKVHVDHYHPLAKGGLHTISNLVVSCPSCNLRKNAKDPIVFANSIGKLL